VRKVLFVAHNHSSTRPGGMELYAEELYAALRETRRYEPLYVAKVGPPLTPDRAYEGTRFALGDGDPNLHFIFTERSEFNAVMGTARHKSLYTEDWRAFLRAHEPELVHFHHMHWLGYDMIRETRRALPNAVLLYTLHDFNPICHHNGQMVRRPTLEPCEHASPRRCHQCFPEIPAQTFFLRQTFIKSTLELIDQFITPSEHARRRYIEWGIPAEKIIHEDYGRIPVSALPDPPNAGERRRIGFFGQITPFKGVDILLQAMKLALAGGTKVELTIHGANLEHQRPDFRERIEALIGETSNSVRFAGAYQQGELPALMSAVDWVVVPSIWSETGPLVIHEAKLHRRPVICSNIGAMPERITDGVNGLHFRTGDPYDLANVIERAVTTPRLFKRLQAAIAAPYPMSEHLTKIDAVYEELLDRAGGPVTA
jgi:glycosyltransferase involved in cell wall biosynthesis